MLLGASCRTYEWLIDFSFPIYLLSYLSRVRVGAEVTLLSSALFSALQSYRRKLVKKKTLNFFF